MTEERRGEYHHIAEELKTVWKKHDAMDLNITGLKVQTAKLEIQLINQTETLKDIKKLLETHLPKVEKNESSIQDLRRLAWTGLLGCLGFIGFMFKEMYSWMQGGPHP